MKVVLLGITGSGKSTTAQSVAGPLNLKVVEADNEVIRLNHGLWPDDEEIIDKYFQVTSDEVLKMNDVLYVISWLSKERIQQFIQNGFKVIELHAPVEELLRRKIRRDNPTKVSINRFKESYGGYYEVVEDKEIRPLLTLSLDTSTMKPEEVANTIISALKG